MWSVELLERCNFFSQAGILLLKVRENAWTREALKIVFTDSKRPPLARSYLTWRLTVFSVRHALRRPCLKFGSKDIQLPVR
jgi:hypothetical protein